MGSSGKEFYSTWEDHRPDIKTELFQAELDSVVNMLRSPGGLLADRTSMRRYGASHPDSAFKGSYTTEYGFRINTGLHTYLLRCNPTKGDYNFYLFCYVKALFDRHLKEARQDIRFIDPHYTDLFRLPDGDNLCITGDNGVERVYNCRYIDPLYVQIGDCSYHICEFAEAMAAGHRVYRPKETPLPPYAFSTLPSTGEIIKITRYQRGYTPLRLPLDAEGADSMNRAIGVSRQQAAAMQAGSMFGWDCPAAHPRSYDQQGKAILSKEPER